MTDEHATPIAPDGQGIWLFVPEAGIYLSLAQRDGGFVDPRYLYKEDGSPSDLNRITWQQARTFTTAYEPPASPMDPVSAFYFGWRATHPDFELIEV